MDCAIGNPNLLAAPIMPPMSSSIVRCPRCTITGTRIRHEARGTHSDESSLFPIETAFSQALTDEIMGRRIDLLSGGIHDVEKLKCSPNPKLMNRNKFFNQSRIGVEVDVLP